MDFDGIPTNADEDAEALQRLRDGFPLMEGMLLKYKKEPDKLDHPASQPGLYEQLRQSVHILRWLLAFGYEDNLPPDRRNKLDAQLSPNRPTIAQASPVAADAEKVLGDPNAPAKDLYFHLKSIVALIRKTLYPLP